MDLSISRMIIVPVMANNYRYYFHSGLLLTGNGCIYIMVALADWYILPILPPIGETFRPFKYRRQGPHAIRCVLDFTPSSWTFGSTRMYDSEYAVSGIQMDPLLQHISMDYCILFGCVIVGLQVQLVCMAMSILTSRWKPYQVIGSIFNH